MKKLISMFLVLAMLLGCTALAEGANCTGVWVLTGAEAEGVQMGPDMLAMFGMSMTATLNEDGTAVLTMNEEAENGTWMLTETGVAIANATGVSMDALYQDEMLIIAQDGIKLMLTREGAAPAVAAKEAAAVLAGVDPVAFEGAWVLTSVNFLGVDMPAEAMGMYMELALAGGSGTFVTMEEEGEVLSIPVSYAVNEVEGVGTVMSVNMVDEESGQAEELLALTMMSDGTLCCAIEEEGLSIACIFARKTE